MTDTIAVVVTDDAPSLARALADELAQAGDDVTLVRPAELDVEISPPYLTSSYACYLALRGSDFAAIVFPDSGGHAYCTVRAKQAGLDFGSTAVVVDCVEPSIQAAEREGRLFLSRRLLGTATAERLSLELADSFLCRDEEIVAWFEREGWTLPPRWPARVRQRPAAEPDTPLITVAIAYHERTDYLPQCLDGFARQTYPALEVLVVDDGSRSPAAAAQLAELEARTWPWPLRVLHEPHGGLGAARNAGWRNARGDFTLFFDDDDVPFDGLVETLWHARVAAGADFAVAGARFFRGEGAPTAHAGDVVRVSLGEPREVRVISNQYGGAVSLWPRELLERHGGFESMPFEDWDFLARATLAGARPAVPPDPVFWYRQTPGGMYSADPVALRDVGLLAISERFAERLPPDLRLLPRLTAGAYSELERRKRASLPRRQVLRDRGRLFVRRARHVREEEGVAAVLRRALRLLRRSRG